ncbi:PP_RS20740 family protein [Euryhalocaulis caribicus]|uniref:PP_RS20740 family protein n=1 Tax=Euryhalocaulis caribicus TaxID=1161401 RepID=UPI0003A7D749|nr:hypothetical protein [Euryhalocaulis caribicus]
MAGGDSKSDRQIAKDVLPVQVVVPAVPVELNATQPWHSPRKQFIREKQWLYHAARLLEKVDGTHALSAQADGAKEVKYLTLPGADYFDVEVLARHCVDKGFKLTSIGFLAGGEDNPYRARAEMRQQELIDRKLITINSHTYGKRIEEVWAKTSTTYKDLRNKGPFHIVNIDACGSLSRTEKPPRLIDAVYRIVAYQLAASRGPWLLFVTTDARKGNIAEDTLDKLNKAIIANAKAESDFRAETIELFKKSASNAPEAVAAASAATGKRFVQLVSLGLSKWLLHLAESKGWQMKVHSSFYYATTPKPTRQPSMPCLAYEFIPPDDHLEDRYGIAVAPATPAHNDAPVSLSMRAVKKVAEMEDLDRRLSNDPDLNAAVVAGMKALLEDAGYPASVINAVK